MVHLLRQLDRPLVNSGRLADCLSVRGVAGLVTLVIAGCTFESAAGQPQPFDAGETGASVPGTSSGATTTGLPVGTSSTQTSEGESDPASDAGSSGDPSTTSSSSSGEPEGSTGEEASSTSGSPVDCTIPITLTQSAGEATVVNPMQLGTFQGVQYAFSLNEGAGMVRFTFEVACPSTYRLFGRVRDDVPGTGSGDPDSFYVEGPGGPEHTWFYGCDTATPGWSWAQVEAGEGADNCSEPVGLMLPLAAGVHEFTLRNREPAVEGAHAGISELVLTNDPTYTP